MKVLGRDLLVFFFVFVGFVGCEVNGLVVCDEELKGFVGVEFVLKGFEVFENGFVLDELFNGVFLLKRVFFSVGVGFFFLV